MSASAAGVSGLDVIWMRSWPMGVFMKSPSSAATACLIFLLPNALWTRWTPCPRGNASTSPSKPAMVSLALKKACRNPLTAACDKSAGKGETNTPGGSCWGRRTRAGRIKALASLSLRNRRRCVWVLPGSGEDRGGWLGGVGPGSREGWGGGLRGWLVKRVTGRACPCPTAALVRPFPFPTPIRLPGPLPRCWAGWLCSLSRCQHCCCRCWSLCVCL